MTEALLDISHISFLDMINGLIAQNGPASAKGSLIRNALTAAERIPGMDFADFEDFVAAIDDGTNPITMVEGKAVHQSGGVFGLPACPFAGSIKNYTQVYDKLPDGYVSFTEEFNKTGVATNSYRVGEGAGVSPFCAVHQPLRSALGRKITIGGKQIQVYQLGCKSGAGKKGFAEKWIKETGVSRDLVDKVLDDNMCCYLVTY